MAGQRPGAYVRAAHGVCALRNYRRQRAARTGESIGRMGRASGNSYFRRVTRSPSVPPTIGATIGAGDAEISISNQECDGFEGFTRFRNCQSQNLGCVIGITSRPLREYRTRGAFESKRPGNPPAGLSVCGRAYGRLGIARGGAVSVLAWISTERNWPNAGRR